jgi:hypothetical protein
MSYSGFSEAEWLADNRFILSGAGSTANIADFNGNVYLALTGNRSLTALPNGQILMRDTSGGRALYGLYDSYGKLLLECIYDVLLPANGRFAAARGFTGGVLLPDGTWAVTVSLLPFEID